MSAPGTVLRTCSKHGAHADLYWTPKYRCRLLVLRARMALLFSTAGHRDRPKFKDLVESFIPSSKV